MHYLISALCSTRNIRSTILIRLFLTYFLLFKDLTAKKFLPTTIPQIYYKERLGILYSGTYVRRCHECFVASSKGCVLIFSNTLYTKEFSDEELSNKKIFRNAVKVSPVGISSITSTAGFVFYFNKQVQVIKYRTSFSLSTPTDAQ